MKLKGESKEVLNNNRNMEQQGEITVSEFCGFLLDKVADADDSSESDGNNLMEETAQLLYRFRGAHLGRQSTIENAVDEGKALIMEN